jgi:hypothetical protein
VGVLDIVVSPVTATGIKAVVPFTVRFMDSLARNSEIVIQFQGDGYSRTRQWFATHERGGRLSLSIKGKPGFCLASLQNLIGAAQRPAVTGSPAEIFATYAAEISRWNLHIPFRDMFMPSEEFRLELTGPGYKREHTFIARDHESGLKCSIAIKGKPGFTQMAAAQLNLNAPFLQQLLSKMLDF